MSLDTQTPTQDESQTVAQKLPVSFYVLSDSKAQDFLGFICQLTQTALNKSSQSLLILAEDDELLSTIDEALWTNEALSFIPHQNLSASLTDIDEVTQKSEQTAPVLLATYLPAEFKGIIINTTSRPVNDFITTTNNAQITRILEIIKPDSVSVEQGRDKYKRYKQLGYELSHFEV